VDRCVGARKPLVLDARHREVVMLLFVRGSATDVFVSNHTGVELGRTSLSSSSTPEHASIEVTLLAQHLDARGRRSGQRAQQWYLVKQ